MPKRNNFRLFSFIFFFLITSPSFGLCENVNSFLKSIAKGNDEYTINETHFDVNNNFGVVIFEDAHCNEPVQKKLMKIIEETGKSITSFGFAEEPIVMQEGGSWGVIDTSILKEDKTRDELVDFANEKLRSGEMGAAEYLHLLKGGFTFFGIEDADLYYENYKYFMDIAKNREDIQALLTEMKEKLDRLRKLVFSDELNEFYNDVESKEKTANLDKHLNEIRLYTIQYSIDMKKYPHLAKYFEAIKALKKLNAGNIESELATLNQTHKIKKDMEDIPALFEEGLVNLRETPELYKYAKLKEHLINTEMFSFVKEKEEIEQELLLKIAYTMEEKDLVNALRDYNIASKILSFTLTKEEYEYYDSQIQEGRDIVRELALYIRSYFLKFSPSVDIIRMQESAEGFYDAVHKRDVVLTDNVLKALKKFNATVGMLIIGGFHTDGMTEILRKKHISYIVVTPKIEELDHDSIDTYYEVMKKFWYEREPAS